MNKFLISCFADESSEDFNGQLDALYNNELHYIEPRGIDGNNIVTLGSSEIKSIHEKLCERNIFISALGTAIGKTPIEESESKTFDSLKRAIDIAHTLDCKRLRIFSFYCNGENKKNRSVVLERLLRMAEYASSEGILLCHENEHAIYGEKLAECLDIHNSIPQIKAVFDPSNFVCADEDIDECIDALIDKIEYFHIKDITRNERVFVPAGLGDGRIEHLLECASKSLCGDVILTIEPHLHVFKGYSIFDGREMKHKVQYKNNTESFGAAVDALKKLLEKGNYCFE